MRSGAGGISMVGSGVAFGCRDEEGRPRPLIATAQEQHAPLSCKS